MHLEKGDKVYFVSIKNGEVEKSEWTQVKWSYVNSTDYWNCATEITLDNGQEVIYGDSQRNTEHLIGNSFLRGCYRFIIDDEKNALSEISKYIDDEINQCKKEIDDIQSVIDNLETVKINSNKIWSTTN